MGIKEPAHIWVYVPGDHYDGYGLPEYAYTAEAGEAMGLVEEYYSPFHKLYIFTSEQEQHDWDEAEYERASKEQAKLDAQYRAEATASVAQLTSPEEAILYLTRRHPNSPFGHSDGMHALQTFKDEAERLIALKFAGVGGK